MISVDSSELEAMVCPSSSHHLLLIYCAYFGPCDVRNKRAYGCIASRLSARPGNMSFFCSIRGTCERENNLFVDLADNPLASISGLIKFICKEAVQHPKSALLLVSWLLPFVCSWFSSLGASQASWSSQVLLHLWQSKSRLKPALWNPDSGCSVVPHLEMARVKTIELGSRKLWFAYCFVLRFCYFRPFVLSSALSALNGNLLDNNLAFDCQVLNWSDKSLQLTWAPCISFFNHGQKSFVPLFFLFAPVMFIHNFSNNGLLEFPLWM